MKKITEFITNSFRNRESAYRDNSYTDGNSLFLFGNKIAEFRGTELWITTAGWDTKTTKERLNALPGVRLYHSNKQLYLNDKLWDGNWIKVG